MTEITRFEYRKPTFTRNKAVVAIARTDIALFAVQVVRKGGETNLHSHPHLDGFWWVLSGRARFYSSADEVAYELDPGQGVLVPRGVPYWFESVGEEELELLQFEASDVPRRTLAELEADRIDYLERRGGNAEVIELEQSEDR